MKKQLFTFLIVTLIFLCGCKKSETEPYYPPSITTVDGDQLRSAKTNIDRKIDEEQVQVFEFATGELVDGAFSRLIRTSKGIYGGFYSDELNPKEVYTLWVIIFENPEFCSDGNCGSDDITDANGKLIRNPDGSVGTPGVNVSGLWVSGTISDKNGNANLRINVEKGQAPGEILYGPGLTDPFGSEIHFIARTHGEVIPSLIDLQLATLRGGCETNACANQQFAIHLPALYD